MDDTSPAAEGPSAARAVTVIARHQVDPGKEGAFESWMAGITADCKEFSGYLGTEVIRPVAGDSGEHVCIFRFATYAELQAWIESRERHRWLEETGSFSSRPIEPLRYHSLEFWFVPEAERRSERSTAPSRHKMALVTFAVIWPMVHFIPRLVAGGVPGPPLALEALSVAVIVLLMTYVVMPLATRVLRPWLFG
jgi:hypothetical protein